MMMIGQAQEQCRFRLGADAAIGQHVHAREAMPYVLGALQETGRCIVRGNLNVPQVVCLLRST